MMRRVFVAVGIVVALVVAVTGVSIVPAEAAGPAGINKPSRVWQHSAGSGFVRVRWHSGYAPAGIAEYQVRVWGSGKGYVQTRSQRATFKGLKPNKRYKLGVRIKDRRGNFSWWTTTIIKTKPRPGARGWKHPLPGARSTSCYGPRGGTLHAGVDLVKSHRARVNAATRGTVISARRNGGYGIAVVVRHPGNIYTLYGHLSMTSMYKGRKLKPGQFVGRQGNTGDSTGSHLHFEVWRGSGNRINPAPFMRRHGVSLGSC